MRTSLIWILLHCLAVLNHNRLLTLVTSAPLPPPASRLPVCENDTDHCWKKSIQGLDAVSRSSISRFFDYSFFVPDRQLSASTTSLGPAVRLRRFVSDLIDGVRPLKVGVVGGSISTGSFASSPATNSWFPVVGAWLQSVARANLTLRNGAVAGTPSSYMVLCLDYSVDPDVDLVFVEYVANDGLVGKVAGNPVVMTVERLLRRLLDLPSRPAVVFMQSPSITLRDLHEYDSTSEQLHGANAAYYDVPTVSAKVAFWHLALSYKVPGYEFDRLFWMRHPTTAGHRVMADLAVHLIQSVALGLVARPVGEQERRLWEAPLPEPMHPGNLPPSSPACVVGEHFTPLVRSSHGFTWVDEGTPGKPKWGYVATDPGASLDFEVDTRRSHVRKNESITLYVYYLSSYTEDWGVAAVRCTAGCECQGVEVDARGEEEQKVSQTQMVRLVATQAEACRIQVTVLHRTSGTGHKFKVIGVVVTEQTGEEKLVKFVLLNRNPYDRNHLYLPEG